MKKKKKKVNWQKLREFLRNNPEIERELKGLEYMHHGRAKQELKEAFRMER
jgi:GrpB-like predicted nucleotidyltransferase (UPF0157 family)